MRSIEETPPSRPVVAGPLDLLLREAVALAEDARAYLARRSAVPRPPAESLLATLVEARETSRLTSRTAHAVAWILARKALAAGELTAEQALAPERRLADRETCLEEPHATEDIPAELAVLLERSAVLYARIDRLDRSLDVG